MSEAKTLNRQQQIGSIVSVLLLVFALAYRFLPTLTQMEGEEGGPASAAVRQTSAPMGFDTPADSASAPTFSEAMSGPPVSLASSDVIVAYREAANAPVSEQLQAWLREGDRAADEGRLTTDDDGAASWYAKVLEADKDNRAAQAGLAEVARRLASSAYTAILNGDPGQARDLLEKLRRVPLADNEVARVEKQLEILTQVTPLLAKAGELLKNEPVTTDKRDEALALYRQVTVLDPDNSVARLGLLKIQRTWLDKALSAVAQSDYEQADDALVHAARVLPASQELQNVRGRVEGMRRLQATNVLAQAQSALDSGELGLARRLADQAMTISPDLSGVDTFNRNYSNAQLYGGYTPGQTFADSFVDRAGKAPGLVVLPIGHFKMGSPDTEAGRVESESPQHEVTIGRGIAMGRTEITVAQFRDFINATGYQTDADRLGSASVYDRKSGRMHEVRGASWKRNYAGDRARDKEPVVNVSWNDAAAYAAWLSEHTGQRYRLPSEAEFEYALRAGTTTPYWWGEGSPTEKVENLTGSRDRASSGRRWIRAFEDYGDGYWGPAPVGQFKANPFGLHDMSGNVAEWVADCWHDNYTRAPHDGSEWVNPGCQLRVVRGGSWGSAPEQVRSAYRVAAANTLSGGRVGFRVVRELSLPKAPEQAGAAEAPADDHIRNTP